MHATHHGQVLLTVGLLTSMIGEGARLALERKKNIERIKLMQKKSDPELLMVLHRSYLEALEQFSGKGKEPPAPARAPAAAPAEAAEAAGGGAEASAAGGGAAGERKRGRASGRAFSARYSVCMTSPLARGRPTRCALCPHRALGLPPRRAAELARRVWGRRSPAR